MKEVKLMVFYPQPLDVPQFDHDYREHLQDVAADTARISTGGAPVVLVGADE